MAISRPRMTLGRAALVRLIDCYTAQSWSPPSLIETQKLMYFLQTAGEPLSLHFAPARYGLYADNLRHVLTRIEGHFINGYGDGSAVVAEAEPLTTLPEASTEAEVVLREHAETRARVERVLDLAAGYESAYGMELLATVHWLMTHGDEDNPLTEDEVVRCVADWSPRKARMFTPNHIHAAVASLRRRAWLSEAIG